MNGALLKQLGRFVAERASSLVSKRVAAVAAGAGVVATQEPVAAGWLIAVYLVTETAWKGWKHYVDTRWGTGSHGQPTT